MVSLFHMVELGVATYLYEQMSKHTIYGNTSLIPVCKRITIEYNQTTSCVVTLIGTILYHM